MPEQPQPLPPALVPKSGYYFGLLERMDLKAEYKAAIEEIADKTADWYETSVDAAYEAVAEPLQWRDELAWYRRKPETIAEAQALGVPYSWEGQRDEFPRDYEHDRARFAELRAREAEAEGA